MLKKINLLVSTFLPQKWYWSLAGSLHPWQAVLEGVKNSDQVYAQGQELVKLLQKLELIDKTSVVLDIGCGVGRLEYALAAKVKKIVGVDISDSMIQLAGKNMQAENVEFLVSNGKDLSVVGRQKFDLIFSMIVFQHLPRDIFEQYLNDSFKLLKQKGKLCFQIQTFTEAKPPEPPRNHPWAIRRYKIEEIKQLLQKLGYKNTQVLNVSGGRLVKTDPDQALFVTCR